ncbi:hypothetical protein [Halalkalicoccus jeotgali]|uniref:Uncharacterized protein n=1 Tax=Halalkalicoccus jeotgali (strain DSM 18796 / CECT 7217 / JCM 14584 / KCTC 4019 / B3) TaxID=795797 RepID=D8J3Z4_HALJB|nr:hypothetical protein [Halalkalicoccus jeotgali]ADJ15386.1 hypothetical protein HacjB3_10015 [Halalkalicoccus jeotgali B3]ELY35838.1 hypothetical protein C497_12656 [Halalkalicoccus jeotgali B3]
MSSDPSFEIPVHPESEYSRDGITRTGGTVFSLFPADGVVEDRLGRVLARERYTAGDWFDLPSPVYLVHDRELGTVFRVVGYDDRVELHVTTTTESNGLRAFYEALDEASPVAWTVECEAVEN